MKNKAAVEQSYLIYNGVYQIRRDSQTQWWASLTLKSESLVVFLCKKLYPHYSVLVRTRNRFNFDMYCSQGRNCDSHGSQGWATSYRWTCMWAV